MPISNEAWGLEEKTYVIWVIDEYHKQLIKLLQLIGELQDAYNIIVSAPLGKRLVRVLSEVEDAMRLLMENKNGR